MVCVTSSAHNLQYTSQVISVYWNTLTRTTRPVLTRMHKQHTHEYTQTQTTQTHHTHQYETHTHTHTSNTCPASCCLFQVNIKELWLTISSVTLAFVFVFGNSIRNIYEAVIFLFVVGHPPCGGLGLNGHSVCCCLVHWIYESYHRMSCHNVTISFKGAASGD